MTKLINITACALFTSLLLLATGTVKHEVNKYDGFEMHHVTVGGQSLHHWYK